MSASIRSRFADSEDDDVMDDAGVNEWSDTGQAPADTAQGPYTRAII